MTTRLSIVAALVATLLSGGCASAPKYPVLGHWLVTSYTAPGTGVPPLDRLAIVGASATIGEGEIRVGENRCSDPSDTAKPLTSGEFTAQYKVALADLELTSDPVQTYEMACGDAGAPGQPRVFIVKDDDTILVPWDGMFYRLTRRAVR
jgi:hypothetical protein